MRLTTGAGILAVGLDRNGVALLRGARALSGEPVIPYAHLQTGNFIFVTLNGEAPWYSQFGVSQTLVYLDAAEIAALSADPLTLGDLNNFQPSFLTTDEGFYLTTDSGGLLTDD